MEFPALITADLHVTHRNLDLFAIFREQVQSFNQKCKSLIIVGDVFDSQDITKWEAILAVEALFDEWDGDIFLLSGTHDALFLQRQTTTLQVFKRHAVVINCRVVGHQCVWIPHSRDLKGDIQFLQKNLVENPLACFTHHMVQGLNLGKFIVPQGLPLALLQQFKWAFNGHIHQPQVHANMISLGSPWQHSFSEANQMKYLWLWDGETIKAIPSLVPTRYLIGSFEALKKEKLEGKFIRVMLKPEDSVDEVARFLSQAGAHRWEFKCSPVAVRTELGPSQEVQFEELFVRYSQVKDIHPDDAQLGKLIFEGRE